MKVKCVSNIGSSLSEKYLKYDYPTSQFPLNIGEEYTVYGITLIRNKLYYLTLNKYYTLPCLFPADLFEVIDNSLPIEWYYKYFYNSENLNAIWGYSELIFNENHLDDLLDGKDAAVRIFLKRKNEIDNL